MFEDNFDLSNKFSTGTQEFVQSTGSGTKDKVSDYIDVTVEAPVVLLEEEKKLWVADLGIFEIKQEKLEENPQRMAVLKIEKTSLFFASDYQGITNLNRLVENEKLVFNLIQRDAHLIVSNLTLSVQVMKTFLPGKKDKKIPSINILCQPFAVDFGQQSLNSFFEVIKEISKDSSREKERINKISNRAELGIKEGVEFNLGYEYWEKAEVYIDHQLLHIVSKKKRTLQGSYQMSQVIDCKMEEIAPVEVASNKRKKTSKKVKDDNDSTSQIVPSKMHCLLINFKYKKVDIRSSDWKILAELQFKINSIVKTLDEEFQAQALANSDSIVQMDRVSSLTQNEDQEEEELFSDDFMIGVRVESIDLKVSGYHKDGIAITTHISQIVYSSSSLSQAEEGSLSLASLSISESTDINPQRILSLGGQSQGPALLHKYSYTRGRMHSSLSLGGLDSVYKEVYVRSLVSMGEFVVSKIAAVEAQGEETRPTTGDAQTEEEEEEYGFLSLATDSDVTASIHTSFKVFIEHSKVSLFYKDNIKCAELISKKIEMSIDIKKPDIYIDGEFGELGLFDVCRYPFSLTEHQTSHSLKVPLVQMKKGGHANFNVRVDGDDITIGIDVDNVVIDWVQQRFMRFIDFIMFQVLEVFYPSLYSFSTYLSREKVLMYCLSVLLDTSYISYDIMMTNIELNLVSTTNTDDKLSLQVTKAAISNKRAVDPSKIILYDGQEVSNQGELVQSGISLNKQLLKMIQTETWMVYLHDISLIIQDDSANNEMIDQPTLKELLKNNRCSSPFDLYIEVDFIVKLFELGFIYKIIDDFSDFSEPSWNKIWEKKNVLKLQEMREKKDAEEDIPEEDCTMATLSEVKAALPLFKDKEQKTLVLNGRYNINMCSNNLKINFTNRLINKIYTISSNNISFDDGADDIFKNIYVNSTKGLQIFINISIENIIMSAIDQSKPADQAKETETEPDLEDSPDSAGLNSKSVMDLNISDLSIDIFKHSDYSTDIDIYACKFMTDFNQYVGMQDKYSRFISQIGQNELMPGLRSQEASKGSIQQNEKIRNSQISLGSLASGRSRRNTGFNNLLLNRRSSLELSSLKGAIKGKIKMTPDYVKIIEVDFYDMRVILFSFLIRLLGEWFTLEPLVEHVGYEDPNYSKITILLKMPNAELCLVSNRDSCLVVRSNVSYLIKMDDKLSQHMISLTEGQFFDCRETEYFQKGSQKIIKRMIAENMNINYFMNWDLDFNTEYEIQLGNLMTKLTAYNLKTLSSVGTFQSVWEEKMAKHTLVDPILVQAPPRDSTSKMKVEMENFSFIYIDNFKNIFLPAVRFDLQLIDFTNNGKGDDSEIAFCLQVKGSYNNSRTAQWEPFIESFLIDLCAKISKQKTSILLSGGLAGSQEGIFLNISEELLEVLIHCQNNASSIIGLQEHSSDDRSQENEDMTIYDSQFLIRNETGYDFFIETFGDRVSKKTKIQNLHEKFVTFIIDDEFCMKNYTSREVKLTFDPESIEETSTVKFSVDKVKQLEFPIGVSGSSIIVTVKKEKLKRVAIISSKLLVVNLTSCDLFFSLFSEEGVFNQHTIPPGIIGERYPIQFNRTLGLATFGIKTGISGKINLTEVGSKRNTSKNLQLICPDLNYNVAFLDIVEKGLLNILIIKPAFKLATYCSIPVEFSALWQNYENNGVIFRSKPVELFRFDPFKDHTQLKIALNNSYSVKLDTQSIIKSATDTQVYLEAKGRSETMPLTICVDRKHNSMTIASRFNLINETGLDLDFYSVKSPQNYKNAKKLIPNGDKTIWFMSNTKFEYIIARSSKKTFTKFSNFKEEDQDPNEETYEASCIFSKKAAYSETFALSGGQLSTYFELNLTILPDTVKFANGFTTKTITVTPRYVFVNSTPFAMNLIQEGCKI